MTKPTVGVFFGSRSTEHDVSIITALASIIKPLELSQKYEVVPVYISKAGRWYSSPKLKDVSLYRNQAIDTFIAKERPVGLALGNGLKLLHGKGFGRREVTIDVAFPATHGTHGEDGRLMGIFEMADLPYVGCDVTSSAIAMDKVLAKQVAAANGIPITKYVAFTKHDYETLAPAITERIKNELSYPLFVKPAHLGSSIAITRVNTEKELLDAIEVALHYDDKALVEEAVPNLIELTLPILGNDHPEPAYLEQPVVKDEAFFDFETKYMQGGEKGKSGAKQGAQGYSTIPADIPKKLYDNAEATGLAVYRALGCGGTARVDMLVDSQTGTVYFNEVNPLPGSLYAHNWQKKGISNVELVCRLVDLAFERFGAKKQFETVFSTDFLKQF
jgi:D-alanine-D-alanine ligase